MSEKKDILTGLMHTFKLKRPMDTLVLLLVAAVGLSLLSGLFSGGGGNQAMPDGPSTIPEPTAAPEPRGMEDLQEHRLKKALSAIRGAGKVEVMITYKTSREVVPAISTAQSSTDTRERDQSGGTREITQTDKTTQPVSLTSPEGSKPLILVEKEPVIQGVIVIAQGASDLMVRLALQRAVQTVLGIYANQVEVFVMDENQIKE